MQYHEQGTRYGIRQDDDGLLEAGAPGVALTWMDAKCNDVVVTPRRGKAIEIQGLWYNALRVMTYFSQLLSLKGEERRYIQMAGTVESVFREKFSIQDRCRDVLDDDEDVLRPNQLIAASLHWSPMSDAQRRRVVDTCTARLVTRYAVRTLDADDPRYCARYEGGQMQRDLAYHQGTAWPWLLGPFVTAHLRVYGDRIAARAFLIPLLRDHVNDTGIGYVSEIFDADHPWAPRGCIAQAWSVAEVLRAWAATEVVTPVGM